MKNWIRFLVVLFPLMFIIFGSNSLVMADRDDNNRKYKEHKEEDFLEEVGEIIGWGSIALAAVAGALLPARKMIKPLRNHYPEAQQSLLPVVKGLGKMHLWIGLGTLLLSVAHGFMMYLAEGELGFREWLGIGASGLMIMAALIGTIMTIQRKKMNKWKSLHVSILIFSGLLILLHVLFS